MSLIQVAVCDDCAAESRDIPHGATIPEHWLFVTVMHVKRHVISPSNSKRDILDQVATTSLYCEKCSNWVKL